MYDLMIIDDDKSIRDRLKKIIKWEDVGVRLVCEASDSDTARELYLINRPKIIITDISIPIISGLELAREIAVIDPEIRFIVITGYSDFEYAKSSVKLGAIDLISKPILPEDMNASLRKAVAYFEKIKSEQVSSQNMKLLLEESMPMLREKFISYLLNGVKKYSSKEINEKLTSLKIDIIGKNYSIALIAPVTVALSSQDIDIILVGIKNICTELLRNAGYKSYSFYDNNYRLNCLISWDFESDNELVEEIILNAYEKINFHFGVIISAGLGRTLTDISGLSAAWHEAFIAMNYQGMLGSSTIINYTNIERLDAPLIIDDTKIIEQLVSLFKKNDIPEMSRLISNNILAIVSSTPDCIIKLRKFIFGLISAIIAESLTLGINISTITGYPHIFENIFSSQNVALLTQNTLEFIGNISKKIFQKQSESKNQLIKLAKEFIKKNLGNKKLNLEMVSRNIGLSSIYFCKLFHKEEGISFNDYLNLERINEGKKLLKETSLKVFEISYTIGYGNTKYFSYVFKRIVGMTPLEYRNSNH